MEIQKSAINWQSIFSAKQILLEVIGVAHSTVAIKGFMIPNHFMDGGVSGKLNLNQEWFRMERGFCTNTLH